jgi:hypothetical protein
MFTAFVGHPQPGHHIFGGAGNEADAGPDPNTVNDYGVMNFAGEGWRG